MRSAGRLPNASSNGATTVGDCLISDCCSGLDNLSAGDILEHSRRCSYSDGTQHDLELRLQESHSCFRAVRPWCVRPKRNGCAVKVLIKGFPCVCHDGLISNNCLGLQEVRAEIVPEDGDVLQFLRCVHRRRSEQRRCSIQNDNYDDMFSSSERNLTVINKSHYTEGILSKSTHSASWWCLLSWLLGKLHVYFEPSRRGRSLILVSEALVFETEIGRYSCNGAGGEASSTHLAATIARWFCLIQVEVTLAHQLMLQEDLALWSTGPICRLSCPLLILTRFLLHPLENSLQI